MQNDLVSRYKAQSVSTMSQGEQLVALYDEALKNLHYGSMLMGRQEYEAAEKCVDKCRRIFTYLSSVLDRRMGMGADLYQMYYYFNQQIVRAQVRRDPAVLDEVYPLVKDLRDAWAQAEKLAHMGKKAGE